jgi:hypothetical protein
MQNHRLSRYSSRCPNRRSRPHFVLINYMPSSDCVEIAPTQPLCQTTTSPTELPLRITAVVFVNAWISLLNYTSLQSSSENLPSWSPDWNSKDIHYSLVHTPSSRPYYYAAVSKPAEFRCDVGFGILHLTRVLLEKITEISGVPFDSINNRAMEDPIL